ncbi:MAG: KH domain-containing protein, partial [Thermoplasmata archaeon]
MPTLYARIPDDRVGALIGPGGRTKRSIALATATDIAVDAEEGEVRLVSPDTDPMGAIKARDIVLA